MVIRMGMMGRLQKRRWTSSWTGLRNSQNNRPPLLRTHTDCRAANSLTDCAEEQVWVFGLPESWTSASGRAKQTSLGSKVGLVGHAYEKIRLAENGGLDVELDPDGVLGI